MQQAAEAALAGEKKSAALVAVNATTGAVLAAVSVNSGGFDQAIDGGFPPGSTFKVITSSRADHPRAHPAVGGELPGHRHGGRRGVPQRRGRGAGQHLLQAFTESCNTAFIRLATDHLTPPDLPAAGVDVRAGPAACISG